MRLLTASNYRDWLRLGVLVLCFFLLGEQRSFGQADTGSISGSITDPSGAVVSGVKITIVAIATNQRQQTKTDGAGRYSSGPIRPGAYRIEAEQTGFKHLVSQAITIEVQQAVTMNLTMEIGGAQEEVTVSTAPPLIQTSDAGQGSVIGEKSVANLPLNGRDYLQLSLLSEGALPPPGQGRSAGGLQGNGNARSGGFSAAGQRTLDNNYLLDGFDNNVDDTGFDNLQAEMVKPSVDAIQEFKVQTSSYPAQFGRAAGGVVNLTLKSGTNQFHGTAYNFLRNEKLDAENFFTVGKKPPYKRNDYGFSVGAPIKRDKAFGFFSWENLLLRETNVDVNTIPTLAERGGDFSALLPTTVLYDPSTYNSATNTRTPFAGNIIPLSQQDSVAQKLIALYPTPQNGNLTNNYTYNSPNWENLGRINTRVDYQVTPKNQLSGIFNRESQFVPASPVLPAPAFGAGGSGDRQTNNLSYGTGLTWTHVVSPSLVTASKAGWFFESDLLSYAPESIATGNVAAKVGLSVPALTTGPVVYPTFTISGYSALGAGNNIPYFDASQIRELINDTTWIKGSHTVQFGSSVEWIQANNQNVRNEEGTLTYAGKYTRNPAPSTGGNAMADFLLGDQDTVQYSTSSHVNLRTNLFSGYLQDEWKVDKQLTLNIGLRYQYLQPFRDRYYRMANVDLDTNPAQPQIVFENQYSPTSFWENSLVDFDPRVGLTYQALNGKLVVRSAYGTYSPFQRFSPWGDSSSLLANPPYTVVAVQTSNGITPNYKLASGIPANIVSLSAANSVTMGSQARNNPHPYAQQWNLNVQYEVARNWMVQVGYFGGAGTHIQNLFDANYVPVLGPGNVNSLRRFKSIFIPEAAAGIPGTSSVGVTMSPLGIIYRTQNNGSTNFNSLQAKVTHEFSGGFSILASYTWSKDLGDLWDNSPGGVGVGFNYQNPANIHGEYGQTSTQLGQAFVASGLWDLPYGHERRFGATSAPWVNAVLGGWSLDTIIEIEGGRPFTVTVNGTPSNSGQTDRANIVAGKNPNGVPAGGRTVAHFFDTTAFAANAPYTYGNEQRNSIIGPNYREHDFALSKTGTMFSLKDQPVNLQFRWDVFNSFNHHNFQYPGATLGTGTFGKLTAANDPRQMQVALKVIF